MSKNKVGDCVPCMGSACLMCSKGYQTLRKDSAGELLNPPEWTQSAFWRTDAPNKIPVKKDNRTSIPSYLNARERMVASLRSAYITGGK